MQRILIAVDGSKAADSAVDVGLDLAAAQQAETTFIYVLAPAATADYHRILLDASKRAERRGIASWRELKAGRSVARAIVEYADEIDADLIVIGMRSLGTVTTALLGSTCRAVLKRTTRPTLVVHAPQAPASTA